MEKIVLYWCLIFCNLDTLYVISREVDIRNYLLSVVKLLNRLI